MITYTNSYNRKKIYFLLPFVFLIVFSINFISADLSSQLSYLGEYYNFSDISGIDIMGNSNMTFYFDDIGNVEYDIPDTATLINGKIGNGVSFRENQSDIHHFAKTYGNITYYDNFSLNGWFKLNASANYLSIFKVGANYNDENGTSAYLGHIVDINDNWLVNNPNWNISTTIYPYSDDIGIWVMFTLIYDVDNQNISLYRNAELIGSAILYNPLEQGELWLAKGTQETYSNLDVDEIAVFDVIISPSEVTELYNNGYGLTYDNDLGNFTGYSEPPATLITADLILPINNSNYTANSTNKSLIHYQLNVSDLGEIGITQTKLYCNYTFMNLSNSSDNIYYYDILLNTNTSGYEGVYDIYYIASNNFYNRVKINECWFNVIGDDMNTTYSNPTTYNIYYYTIIPLPITSGSIADLIKLVFNFRGIPLWLGILLSITIVFFIAVKLGVVKLGDKKK